MNFKEWLIERMSTAAIQNRTMPIGNLYKFGTMAPDDRSVLTKGAQYTGNTVISGLGRDFSDVQSNYRKGITHSAEFFGGLFKQDSKRYKWSVKKDIAQSQEIPETIDELKKMIEKDPKFVEFKDKNMVEFGKYHTRVIGNTVYVAFVIPKGSVSSIIDRGNV